MDPAAPPAPTAMAPDEDDWDAEGFEIPSLNTTKKEAEKPPVESLKPVLSKPIITQTENLYLGPHGAKPGLKTQQQPQDVHSSGKKRFKHRIRDVDQLRGNSFGRENKVEVLRDLMGRKSVVTARSSSSGGGGASWLDPHCQESLFEKSSKTRKP